MKKESLKRLGWKKCKTPPNKKNLKIRQVAFQIFSFSLGKICKVIFLSVKMLARIFWSLTALKKSSKDLLPAKYLDWNVTVFSVSQCVCTEQQSERLLLPAAKALALLTPQEFQWIFSACQTTVWTKGKSWEKTDSSDTKFKIYALDGALPDF